MAIDDTGGSDEQAGSGVVSSRDATVGEYSWSDFRREEHDGGQFDRSEYLGFDPRHLERRLVAAASGGKTLGQEWDAFRDPESRGVVRGEYTWEHFKQEYYYDENGNPPRDDQGNKIPFDSEEYLGFPKEMTEDRLNFAGDIGSALSDVVDTRTVDVAE